MQVSKWGDSLARRLPASVVEALGLSEGDDVEIVIAGSRELEVSRNPGRWDQFTTSDYLWRCPAQ